MNIANRESASHDPRPVEAIAVEPAPHIAEEVPSIARPGVAREEEDEAPPPVLSLCRSI